MSLIGVRSGTARAEAVLPAAGAYDASPTSISCEGFEDIAFQIAYGRGAVNGAVTFKVEFSNNDTNWFQTAKLETVTPFAAGADSVENTQKVEFKYTSTGVVDFFMTPTFHIGGKWCRISLKESGVAGTPGTAAVLFYQRGYN